MEKIILVLAFAFFIFGLESSPLITKKKLDPLRKKDDQLNCDYGTIFNGSSCEICGLRAVEADIRIVGGSTATPYSWPYQVLIIRTIQGNYVTPSGKQTSVSQQYLCGGTLINSYTVLTAAHCISDTFSLDDTDGTELKVQTNSKFPTMGSMFSLYFGVFNKDFLNYGGALPKNVIMASVAQVVRHEAFDIKTLVNDIALLILTTPIQSNDFIKPACLPQAFSTTYPTSNQKVFAVGWGTISEGGVTSSKLKNLKILTYDPLACSRVATELPQNWEAQICAGNLAGGQDTCQGDSGGALYSRTLFGKQQRSEVVGVVSYGNGCAAKGMPGIYTRTSYYLDWIKSNWKTPSF